MPFGGVEALMASPRTGLESMMLVAAAAPRSAICARASTGWSSPSSARCSRRCPVSWVYIAIRNRKDYDQSLVDTIVILPIVVTSIIIIVQNSLALAFSIAGIAAAVRFRNSLKSSGDALFILLAVGIGLSAGIGALELAIVMSVAFNYVFLMLWVTDYGDRARHQEALHDRLRPGQSRAGTGRRAQGGARRLVDAGLEHAFASRPRRSRCRGRSLR